MQKILKLGHIGATLTSQRTTNWIGVDHTSSGNVQKGGMLMLGRECNSLAELQAVAAQLKSEIDEIVREARF